MASIDILAKNNGQIIQSLNADSVILNQNSVVKIGVKIEDVANILREGNAAVITLKNGEKIVVENYFDPAVNESLLVFEGNNGELYWAEFTDSSGQMLETIKYHPFQEELLSAGSLEGLLPWIGGAVAIGGIAAAASSGGGSSGSGNRYQDTTPPQLVDSQVSNGIVELNFNEPLNSTIVPSVNDFTLFVDGNEVEIERIEIVDNKIVLIPVDPIEPGQIVSIEYKDNDLTDGNGIADNSGNQLAEFEIEDVSNPDTVPPQLDSVKVNAAGNIELSFNEDVSGSDPRNDDFTVTVDGVEVPVTNIIADGNTLTLITDPEIAAGQTVEVVYNDTTPDDEQGIRDSDGYVLEGFDAAEVGGVENNSEQADPDVDPPVLIDAEVNAAGNIELSFNEDVSGSDPRNDDFTVTVDGVEVPVTNIIADGNTLTLITDPEIAAGQTVEVVYNDTTPNDEQGIRDSDGNVLEGFDAAEVGGVENSSEQADPDVDPPVLIDAEVNAAGNIELSFNEDVSGSDPRNDDFTVTVDGVEVPVTNIIADGNTLTLITDPEIAAGQTVEVVYNDTTPDDEQGIRDSDGNVLEGFDAAEVGGVENNSEQADPDVDPPVLIDAEVNAAGNIELSFNEDVSGSDPRNDDFTVTVDGVEVPVTNIIADGNTLTLITDPEIAVGQTVEVVYNDTTPDDEQGIRDSDGNVLEGFDAAEVGGVENNSEQADPDVDPPVLIDAEVNAAGNIELSFNEDVSGSDPRNDDFTVTVDGVEVPVTNIIADGNTLTLITDPEIAAGQTVEVVYNDTTPNDEQGIRDSDGNVLEGFDAAEVGGVENSSEQADPDVDPPVLIDAEVNAAGNIELSFNEDVSGSDPRNDDFTVTVDGVEVPVTNIIADGNTLTLITDPEIAAGQTVEVVYNDTTPDDEQGIRDSDGNVLEGFDAAEVGGVENNSEQADPDVDPPVLIDAEVNAAGNIELSFNEDVSGSDPRNDDFTVTVDGVEVPVTNIIADGNTLTLITDPEIAAGQTVEVVYNDTTPDDEQGIRDSDGNVLEGFDAAEVGGVENNSEQADPDVDPPVLIDAEVNAAGNIELSFNEDVSGSDPRNDDFTVTVDGVEVPVTNIIADGNTLTLITDPEIAVGQTVEVVYNDTTPDDEQGIRDSDGNVLEGFDAAEVGGVENNSEQADPDVDPPVLIDAEVNAAGNIELSFNEDVSGSDPRNEDFTVTVDGVEVPVTNIEYDDNQIILITNPVIRAGQEVTVTYTDSTLEDEQGIRDSDGNVLDIFDAISMGGVENNSESLISLADDNISATLVGPQNATEVATYSDSSAIELLNGSSEVAVLDFTIEEDASSVVIVVQQDNLVSLANAFTFVVRNTATGEEFEVASANTSQGGLVAGALGLELLGVVADAQGLRLDINDLPPGNYEVSVYGDSSQLADILTTIDLANLGDGTVNNLVSDTVLGLLETALTGPDVDPRGLLEKLTLSQLLDVTSNTSIPALNTLTATVNSILSVALDNVLVRPILGNVYDTSVGELLAGNADGLLGLLLTELGLGSALDSLVNGVLANVDNVGQLVFDNLVEPLVRDILLETVLEGTGLTTGLDTLLGSLNTLLETLGLGDVLPTVDGLIDLIAQEALSNPLTLFGGTTAKVYEVNGEVYRATGNIQEASVDGTQADNWAGGVLTAINGKSVTFESSDEGGNYTTIEGTYGQLKLYENGNFSYVYNSVAGQNTALSEVFTYTVTRNAGQENEETASADLTINIDTVNQIINYADDPADNLLQGGAGDDILTGGAGADTAIYYLLDNADATGGNGTDIWTDFSLTEGDAIDVSALLSGANAENISEYISVEVNDNNATVISIDRDGAGTQFQGKVELITLEGVNTNLEELLSNGHIIY